MNKSIIILLSSCLLIAVEGKSVQLLSTLLSTSDATSNAIPEAFVRDGFIPGNNAKKPLGMCESDCDQESDCIEGLVCADQYTDALIAIGLDSDTANCYNANVPENLEVCFDPSILNTAGAGGDPHFRTYDNTMYSFHGQCDLVMAASQSFDNGLGLDVHARTEIVDGTWSLISNVAVRVGEDIFEIVNDQSHYYNGMKDVELPILMAGKYRVSVVAEDMKTTNESGEEVIEKQLTYSVDLVNQNAITLQNYRSMISVNVGTYLHDTHGMLGYRTKKGMVGRDGETQIVDPNEMGAQWQVRDFEPMLFHNVKGQQYPEPCLLPVVADQRRRRLRHSQAAMDAAAKACASVNENMRSFCVEDVLRTGDVSMAQGYGTW